MTRTWRTGRPAFTLVELLVVIGILAALVALLLSVLGSARRQARIVQCSAGLRTIGQACLLHAAETEGYVPLAGRVTAPPGTDGLNFLVGLNDVDRRRYMYVVAPRGTINPTLVPFTAALAPYLGVAGKLPKSDDKVLDDALNAPDGVWKRFVCPDTGSLDKPQVIDSFGGTSVAGQGAMLICAIGDVGLHWWGSNSDYAPNEGIFGFHYDPAYRRNRLNGRLAAVRHTAEVVLFTDAVPRETASDARFPLGWLAWTPSLAGAGRATLGDALAGGGRADSSQNFDRGRHNGRVNVVFADGHTETLPIEMGALNQAYLVEP
jgi:prepilin-type processing-associated H-X9-DG protein/prepilin-type N-terminal cleavage/methylation domain-containing protein